MRVPLAAHRVSPAACPDRQMIDVWTNGRLQRVPAPFLPYMYSKSRLGGEFARETRVTVRPLSTLEPEEWWRYEFATVAGVSQASRGERPPVEAQSSRVAASATFTPLVPGRGTFAENHVAFIERVLVDEPAFFERWPNTDPLRVMYIDIEQLSSGKGFPTERDPLIAIAWAVNDAAPECVLGDGKTDAGILEAFLAAIRTHNPDVIAGYNVDGYDLPMILKRLRANRMDAGALSRTGRAPAPEDEGEDLHLEGRLVYDVFDSVLKDQTLFGIKDRKLKTVGAWLRFNVIKEDVTDLRALVGTERLRDYNVNDVALTRSIAKIYWKNFEALAEFYGAPLNVVMRATPAFHMTMLQGRVFRRAEPPIVSDGKNEDRHSSLYFEPVFDDSGMPVVDERTGEQKRTKLQAFVGGIVEIYQKGLFTPIYKCDFSSMYPSIMVSLGTGADNTRILGTEPQGPFTVKVDGERRTYSIPDESRKLNLVVEIAGFSPMAAELRRLLQERITLKKAAKAATDPDERERLNATQNVMKVVLNAVYGVHAASFARYGSLPVAVATVGVARRLIRIVEAELGDAKIETDTDGVYTAKPPDVKRLNGIVADFVQRELGGENYTNVEADSYEAGYFHQRKSYLLLHKDGRIEKHGIAFKGSSLCGVFDKSLDRVSRALLTGKEDPKVVGRECLEMGRYDPADFVMRVRLGKSLDDYKAGSPIGKQVAEKYRAAYGRTPDRGEQLEYVRVKKGKETSFEIPSPEAMKSLDLDYYREIVENVLDRLDIDWRPTQQKSLAEWF